MDTRDYTILGIGVVTGVGIGAGLTAIIGSEKFKENRVKVEEKRAYLKDLHKQKVEEEMSRIKKLNEQELEKKKKHDEIVLKHKAERLEQIKQEIIAIKAQDKMTESDIRALDSLRREYLVLLGLIPKARVANEISERMKAIENILEDSTTASKDILEDMMTAIQDIQIRATV